MNNFRLFIGISLAPAVTGLLSALMDRMAADLPFRKWTHPSDLHVTLHFLGETPEERVGAIRDAMEESAAEAKPFSLALTAPGTFGPPNAPRILWSGLAEPAAPGALSVLHASLTPKLAAAGCSLEDRPFRAHVTLARQGGAGCRRDNIEAVWQTAKEAEGVSGGELTWTADQIALFHTHLGRRPSYERIFECPLGAARIDN
jgi:2'-5' RNA ligase